MSWERNKKKVERIMKANDRYCRSDGCPQSLLGLPALRDWTIWSSSFFFFFSRTWWSRTTWWCELLLLLVFIYIYIITIYLERLIGSQPKPADYYLRGIPGCRSRASQAINQKLSRPPGVYILFPHVSIYIYTLHPVSHVINGSKMTYILSGRSK